MPSTDEGAGDDTRGEHGRAGAGRGRNDREPVGGAIVFKATAAETGGTMTVFETIVAPGEGPPLHVHANEDEAVYVPKAISTSVSGRTCAARRPAFLFIPRGTPHTFQNVGGDAARFLVIFTPSGMDGSSSAWRPTDPAQAT
jgi:quercetin dioxygenase-like cupin family protein